MQIRILHFYFLATKILKCIIEFPQMFWNLNMFLIVGEEKSPDRYLHGTKNKPLKKAAKCHHLKGEIVEEDVEMRSGLLS